LGGDVVGRGPRGKPRFGRSLTLPGFTLPAPEAFRVAPVSLPLNSKLQAEPVVGEKGVFGQLLLGGRMTEIVAEVGEVGLPWTEPLG
jgi:hypothetical protein